MSSQTMMVGSCTTPTPANAASRSAGMSSVMRRGRGRDQRRLAVPMIELPLMIAVRRAGIKVGNPAQIVGR
jgi:hypothetical protein